MFASQGSLLVWAWRKILRLLNAKKSDPLFDRDWFSATRLGQIVSRLQNSFFLLWPKLIKEFKLEGQIKKLDDGSMKLGMELARPFSNRVTQLTTSRLEWWKYLA